MTTVAAHHGTVMPSSPPSQPRLLLAPARASQSILDGGWWPRSSDPVVEVPGLVLALSDRCGPIRQVMLNSGAWDSRFRRIVVAGRIVRMGWFTTLDPALAIATTERGNQVDVLVVPPATPETAARSAMAQAADPANTMRAPDVLAAALVVAPQAEADPDSVWDNEGGHLAEARGAVRQRRTAEMAARSPQ
jgi:hypothetical protein